MPDLLTLAAIKTFALSEEHNGKIIWICVLS